MNYTIKINRFEGPFEILLDCIEREKLSINEVALAQVADGFLHYVKTEAVDHYEFASFLVVASTLMLIKSRSLLPGFEVTKEEERSIQELEERLAMYKRIRAFAQSLGERARAGRLFSRPAFAEERPAFVPPQKLAIEDLRTMLDRIIARIPKAEELPQTQVQRVVSIEEKIAAIEARIREGIEVTFQHMTAAAQEKIDVILNFLALLELFKQGKINLWQKNDQIIFTKK